MNWRAAQQWLAETRPVRDFVDAAFRALARRRLVDLDGQAAARRQVITLLGLVHRARQTRFGREHDFARIQSAADFRRLVPLTTTEDLALLSEAALPGLNGQSPSPSSNSTALARCQRSALFTAFALAIGARPRARLLSGKFLYLTQDRSPLVPEWGADPGFACNTVPALLRPYTLLGTDPLATLVERSLSERLTCLAGETVQLQRFAALVRQRTGKDHLTDVWPQLAVVLCLGNSTEDEQALAHAELGSARDSAEVLVLKACLPPAGPVAVEDPRHGLLRLLPDTGVFFEFVPSGQSARSEPVRHTLADVEPGQVYDLAMTTPAGLWACRTGLAVRFERREPPLLHLVKPAEVGNTLGERVRVRLAHPPVQPPHPRTRDIPAARPERLARTPLSTHGDRE